MNFTLHAQLAADCYEIGDLPLCRLLLLNDSQYPWFILVPRRMNIREIHELSPEDRQQLYQESEWLCLQLLHFFKPYKLNTAALGNLVSQLHLHHIVRYLHDPAWPAPVWGKHPAIPYQATAAHERIDQLHTVLQRDWPSPAPVQPSESE